MGHTSGRAAAAYRGGQAARHNAKARGRARGLAACAVVPLSLHVGVGAKAWHLGRVGTAMRARRGPGPFARR